MLTENTLYTQRIKMFMVLSLQKCGTLMNDYTTTAINGR
jgi:hypothetical protein